MVYPPLRKTLLLVCTASINRKYPCGKLLLSFVSNTMRMLTLFSQLNFQTYFLKRLPLRLCNLVKLYEDFVLYSSILHLPSLMLPFL